MRIIIYCKWTMYTHLHITVIYWSTICNLSQGWKLLAQPCPISGFPLVEKDGEIFSVRCNMAVMMEGSLNNSQRAKYKTVDQSQNRELFRLLRMGWKVFAWLKIVVILRFINVKLSLLRVNLQIWRHTCQLLPEKCPFSGGMVMLSPDGKQKYGMKTHAFCIFFVFVLP